MRSKQDASDVGTAKIVKQFLKCYTGCGTDKDAIIGVVERGGNVVAQLAHDVSGRTILDFIKRAVNINDPVDT